MKFLDIQLIGISKAFEQIQVFKNLNLTFTEGRIHCIMGASGIGKTTLLNLLMGLIKPDAGQIIGLEGIKIASVFQEDRLIEHWDAIQNVKLVCEKSITVEQIEEEFRKVRLDDYKNKPVLYLSGGMRRRVAIIRAILAPSQLLILDEPFKGLDEELKNSVIRFLVEKTKGKTVIVVTHEKDEVEALGGNIVKL